MKAKPLHVAQIHRDMCRRKGCPHLDQIDYVANCCACPERHFPDWDCRPGELVAVASAPALLPPIPPTTEIGAGTILKALLARFGISDTQTCGCQSLAADMDRHGLAWCRENMDRILDHMAVEASNRKLLFIRSAARILVLSAIRQAERRGSDSHPISAQRPTAQAPP